MTRDEPPDRSAEEPVPLFGTWRVAYASVVLCTLLTMAALYFFQGWPF